MSPLILNAPPLSGLTFNAVGGRETLMIPGVGVIASMCKRCVKMQSPELCKPRSGEVESTACHVTIYKYNVQLLYGITIVTCLVKVRKIQSLKLRPAAPQP